MGIYKLGIDIGSTTLKVSLLDEADRDVAAVKDMVRYRRHHGSPAKVMTDILGDMERAAGDVQVQVCMTGSVGMGYAQSLGLDFMQEVIAATEVIRSRYPEVHTFVDMGGEDSKMIFFEEGRIPDMRMNGNCAGGTGSFIDQTATLLGVETEELDRLAKRAEHLHPIASRCGVFSKTDIQNLQIQGGVGTSGVGIGKRHGHTRQGDVRRRTVRLSAGAEKTPHGGDGAD